ncbi:MAG: hypothetical protein M3040_15255 [Bacteroidota bacterium]|nr:hypothetical protein [Bacteroidota bacterium]
MSTKILVTILAFSVLAGCSKDKFTSKPQLTYKKVNTKFLSNNETLTFTLGVTDLEGDVQDSLWVQEIVKGCSSSNSGFTSKYKMPDFNATKNLQGDIEICYAYGLNLGCPAIVHSGCVNRNDTATFRFWMQDKAKNKSDTIVSDQVVISK